MRLRATPSPLCSVTSEMRSPYRPLFRLPAECLRRSKLAVRFTNSGFAKGPALVEWCSLSP